MPARLGPVEPSRRRLAACVVPVAAAALLSGCGSDSTPLPPPIAVRCQQGTYHPSSTDDVNTGSAVFSKFQQDVTAVTHRPRRIGSSDRRPDEIGQSIVYRYDAWTLHRVDGRSGKELRRYVTPHPPPNRSADTGATGVVHRGPYVIASGGPSGSLATALGPDGQPAAACGVALSAQIVALLPGAGVVVVRRSGDWYEGHRIRDNHRVWGVRAPALVIDGSHVFTHGDGQLTLFDVRTGDRRWQVAAPKNDDPSPDAGFVWADGDQVYSSTTDRDQTRVVHAFAARSGHSLWNRRLDDLGGIDVHALAGGYVALAGYSRISLVRAANGSVVRDAHLKDVSLTDTGPVRIGGHGVLLAKTPGRMTLLGTDGSERTIRLTASETRISVVSSTAYVLTDAGGTQPNEMLAYDLVTGRRLWSMTVPAEDDDIVAYDRGFALYGYGRSATRYG